MRLGAAATIALTILVLLPFPGCGNAPPQAPPTLPVKGKVTFKGKPVTKGAVTFEPDGMGKEAHGDIQPDGTFELTTYKPGDGAVPGTHRVAVSYAGKTIPLKYTNVASSKVEVEVTEGKTDYTIDLK
jgi:hypothetical protein